MKFMKLIAMAGVALTVALGVSEAKAATTTTNCPGATSDYDRYFALTLDLPITSTCHDFGTGNIPEPTYEGRSPLDKNDDLVSGLLDSTSGLNGGNGGTFSIDLTGLKNIQLGFKIGAAEGACQGTDADLASKDCEPDWAIFNISAGGIVSGRWDLLSDYYERGGAFAGLSHISLYADRCTENDPLCDDGDLNQVPVPASLPLLAGGLVLAGFVARRKSRKA
ncbi:PEP-CTERM sorting domain-containing protein [Seohaeicola zhoushanensis]|uniref:VPLPA-CTERM sorting domain-containing protein n=1 Tax=Seohaeicola zhoushanensis TaxID=1569283 RepID=A0A8J3H176_9RHOB|nr:PEP-CTERM sorting domain-containing protein [Seohaeicola zhoushanensis]GHF63328.1 hypothetical protein GCM10017056_38240 [Seohaeicola zhoushanensis]